jgi:hypothetical protein
MPRERLPGNGRVGLGATVWLSFALSCPPRIRCAGGGRRTLRGPEVPISSSSSEVSLELLLPSCIRFREGSRSRSSGGVDFGRGG